MSLSKSLSRYLHQNQTPFDTITHPRSTSAMQSAIAAHVQASQIAKAVVLKDPVDNYLMAVIPGERRLHLHVLEDILETPLKLADQQELDNYFKDCESGAIPPMGAAFNMEMIWDDRLMSVKDIYFEGGDHETLVHMTGETFRELVNEASHNQISRPERSELL